MKDKKINIDFRVENPNYYRILWKSLQGPSYGIGAYADNYQDALYSVIELNKVYPKQQHWAAPNPGLN